MLQEVHNDICARLPYGVIVHTKLGDGHLCEINQTLFGNKYRVNVEPTKRETFTEVTPYLRPMSSMTEEDVQDIRNRLNNLPIGRTITKENFEKCCDFLWFTKMSSFECVSEKMMDVVIGYLDENMFDHRGLIPMGLALEAPEDMYK